MEDDQSPTTLSCNDSPNDDCTNKQEGMTGEDLKPVDGPTDTSDVKQEQSKDKDSIVTKNKHDYNKRMGTSQAPGFPGRGHRNSREQNLPTDIFTPRTYQVELLDTALQRNTIVCLGEGTGKCFLAIMLIKELAYLARKPLKCGGKRTILITNSEDSIAQYARLIQLHTDLSVGECHSEGSSLTPCTAKQWHREIKCKQVLVMTAQTILSLLQAEIIPLSLLNLLIFDECHVAVGCDIYAQIMKFYNSCPKELQPRLLGLTTVILSNKCSSPGELEKSLHDLETTLNCTAETASDLIIPDAYGAKPEEIILECDSYNDTTGLVGDMLSILEPGLAFVLDCGLKPEDYEGGDKDPRTLAKTVFTECLNILHLLGPWCCGKVAQTLAKQLSKIADHEKGKWQQLFLHFAHTQLMIVQTMMEQVYDKVLTLEDFTQYMSPKVQKLLDALRTYKPSDDFVIIGGDDFMDMGDGSDDDSFNLSDDDDNFSDDEEEEDEEAKLAKQQASVHYVAVKRKSTAPAEADSPHKEDEGLCGIVFVERRHTAFILNKLLQEVCNWDVDLYFLKSSHITGQPIKPAGGKQDATEVLYKKQEDLLRKFRQKEINLLISTSVLEEGVDIPKCNFVSRYELPSDYRSYIQSKSRARGSEAKFLLFLDVENSSQFQTDLNTFREIERILTGRSHDWEQVALTESDKKTANNLKPPYIPKKENQSVKVTMTSAISLVNRYCAKLPSDAFTHLTPKCDTDLVEGIEPPAYTSTLQLPINSPIKQPIVGDAMPNKHFAQMAVAMRTCQILHEAGEIDDQLMPVGKEVVRYEDDDDEEWEDSAAVTSSADGMTHSQARPGTTKRKQYYYKKIADALLGHPAPDSASCLYILNMSLRCPITEEQNTRGRKIHPPEETPRCFGLLLANSIPSVPAFPVFTRSGEVTVSVDLVSENITMSQEEISRLLIFHHYVVSHVLRLEKDPMCFKPDEALSSYVILPLLKGEEITVDWDFVSVIEKSIQKFTAKKKLPKYDPDENPFVFKREDFEDAVIMPMYRNIDQPQYFYVAEIRFDLNPCSTFPSPELYDTFRDYYKNKYGLLITNLEQPLLDVDHTSARLNLLTPRYMNQKGMALPTSSAETRRARRENLQQKQILIPELCDIHPFPASFWRKAVCLPAILYRTNYLLIAEEIRYTISKEAHIGLVQLPNGFRFPPLEFGFSTTPNEVIKSGNSSSTKDESTSAELVPKDESNMTSVNNQNSQNKEANDGTIVAVNNDDDDDDTDTENNDQIADTGDDCQQDNDLDFITPPTSPFKKLTKKKKVPTATLR